MPKLGFFPGSTVGNLLVPDAVDLLRAMAATLGAGSMLLIGIDRIKDADILLPAYDDAQGVTAAFNLNLLHRINRELVGSVPVDAFNHLVRWDDAEARIEMHLEAARDVHFSVDGRLFSMTKGEQSQIRDAGGSLAPACRRLVSDRRVDRSERVFLPHSREGRNRSTGALGAQ